ncbi:SpvB/TcaC N-terminal domain-containing protein [Stackebrandtia nassauensis]|uniref:YD repeat protein n=1 Tax=Stackebrandtia nassauensis (strain DSM 44728 / CIP 108903 / NRRL B-16338 / NBRC 102104 / LLR-40K-21) TaxID=446470 RepID=D3PZB5_STANL|nr:SpvB/TcaC N-terminal domain-containing protein [Stackebrandtia nassauensis]ADD41589.1 YD repeat protein [Stackebrandtia nassauensis DSM 44728]
METAQPRPDDSEASTTPTGPSLPEISLPTGGGAVRGIGEKFAANPATGTGSTSVPIATSPGRAGFGPSLSLGYDSGNGNGPFGIGWRLSLANVTRKTDKGLPRYDDSSPDTYILSDTEDLVPIPGIQHRLHEGKGFTVRRYQPRVESGHSRIEQWTHDASGESHWRVITGDNLTNRYGTTAESRIADPRDPRRIFTWLLCESVDSRGNAMLYEYKTEDAAGVDVAAPHEATRTDADRTAQRYLKRIRYGNTVSRLLEPDLSGTGWLFEVVFDYGEHDTDSPAENRDWDVRVDPFSSYRSGFEVRSYRRCQRVLMFHHFPELPPDTLVNATGFEYRDDPVGSFMSTVRRTGYRRDGAGYVTAALPPLEYDYTRVEIDTRPRQLDESAMENLPVGVEGPGYQWVDLDGEGLSGVLSQQATGLFYKPNLGDGHFGPIRQVSSQPSLADIDGPGQRLVDLAGDGSLDLVDLNFAASGFFERGDDGEWRSFRTFASPPNLDAANPNLRMVDLTGDGLADILITEDDVFTWHPSLSEDGYGAAMRTYPPLDEADGPRLVFAHGEDAVYLADMSGDGLSDMVRVRNGEVCYWPNLGYGVFGARVTMDDSPWLDEPDQFDPRRIRLADIDGSGTVDLIYLHRTEARVYRNRCGNAWEAPQGLGVAFPRADWLARVSTVDLLGNGTACLVWSSPLLAETGTRVRYLDLMGSTKPHLLTSIVNNMGAETRIEYTPSTRFYLDDQRDGRDWITRLPFPVHVVSRVEIVDRISGHRFATTYTYHHGYFDGVEREFRGFAMVEQLDTETFPALAASNVDAVTQLPPVLMKTWFHTGAHLGTERISRQLAGEYYRPEGDAELLLPDTVLPDGLSPEEERQALRALRGKLLRKEVFALDGGVTSEIPYTVVEQNYGVRRLREAGPDGFAVFQVHGRETITADYERTLYTLAGQPFADPRLAHEVVLRVDEFGNTLASAAVNYPRRFGDPELSGEDALQRLTQVLYTEFDYTNTVDDADDYRLPQPSGNRAFEIRGLAPVSGDGKGFNVFDFTELEAGLADTTADIPYRDTQTGVGRRLVEQVRVRYRRDDLDGPLPFGVLEAQGLPFESYRQAFTPDMLDELYGDRVDEAVLAEAGYVGFDGALWAPSGRGFLSPAPEDSAAEELAHARSHFFGVRRVRDAFGATSVAEYDEHDLAVVVTRDPLGNEVRADNDYRVLLPWQITDPNGNRNRIAYDALGEVAGTAVMAKDGQDLGDSLDDFTIDLSEADIAAYVDDPRESAARLLGTASNRVLHDRLAYLRTRDEERPSPVASATIARETHVSDLDVGAEARLQHRLSYSDGFGREIQRKAIAEPGPVPGGGTADPRWIVSGWTVFNNKGKPVRQYEPFYSDTHRYQPDSPFGVSPVMFYDPLTRVVAVLNPDDTWEKTVFDPWRQDFWDASDTLLTDPRKDGDIGGFVQSYFDSVPDWTSWYEQRVGGELGQAEREAARATEPHAGTFATSWFDSQGRTFLSLARNRFVRDGATVDERQRILTELDIEGNELRVTDALGRVMTACEYDMLGQRVSQSGMDSGRRLLLDSIDALPVRAWHDNGFDYRNEYDVLRRATGYFVSGGDLDGEIQHERIEYGETVTDASKRNLRLKVHRRFDAAGVAVNRDFDFKGNPVRATRQLATEYRRSPDWSTDVPLEAAVHDSRTGYDALNRPVRTVAPDGTVSHPRFNESGLLDHLEVRVGGVEDATEFVSDVGYDAQGRRTRVDYGNGTVTTYEYHPLTFRLTRLHTVRGKESVQDLSYVYDPSGNLTRITDRTKQAVFFRNQRVEAGNSYTYDSTGRLIEAHGREHLGQLPTGQDDERRLGLPHPNDGKAMARYVERYDYDAVGNLLSVRHRGSDPRHGGWTRRYHYAEASLIDPADIGNRLTDVGDASFAYDAHGNVTAMPELPVMAWNFKDQLSHSSRQSVDDGDAETTYYVYDNTGERMRKVTEHGGQLRSERVYLGGFEITRTYTGGDLDVERQSFHVMDDKKRVAIVDRRVAGEDPGAESLTRYQLADHLGSSGLELDDQAQVISFEEYYPFGGTSFQSTREHTETPKRYRFTGKERDTESGLYYQGARYYAPWLGRWTSADPAGPRDGACPYAYVGNNPLRRTDPSGLEGDEPEQLNFAQSPAFWQQVTATAKGRGISDATRANLQKVAQMWGLDGPIAAGHLEDHPFWSQPAGTVSPVYAQNALSNALQSVQERADSQAAKAAGLFARVGGADPGAVPGTKYGQPPTNPNFLTPGFQSWTPPGPQTPLVTLPATTSAPVSTPLGPAQQSFAFPEPPAQFELFDSKGQPTRPQLPVSTAAPQSTPRPPSPPSTPSAQVEMDYTPRPPTPSPRSSGASLPAPGGFGAAAGNGALAITRGVVPGVVEAELAFSAGAYYTASAAAATTGTTSTALAATSAGLTTAAAYTPVVGASLATGAVVGNLAESGATSLGASQPVAEAVGAGSATLAGAGVGALVGSVVPGVGTAAGAAVGAAAGYAGYLISKYW